MYNFQFFGRSKSLTFPRIKKMLILQFMKIFFHIKNKHQTSQKICSVIKSEGEELFYTEFHQNRKTKNNLYLRSPPPQGFGDSRTARGGGLPPVGGGCASGSCGVGERRSPVAAGGEAAENLAPGLGLPRGSRNQQSTKQTECNQKNNRNPTRVFPSYDTQISTS